MKTTIFGTLAFVCLAAPSLVHAQQPSAVRPVHTFSIVARDPRTGDLGMAVQSHWFAVGAEVTWAEAGVGAIATQSFIDPSYGPLGLDLLRAGKSADEALRALLAVDPHADSRQVAIVDSQGNVACFTGAKDIPAAGCAVGKLHKTASGQASQADSVMDELAEKLGLRIYLGADFSAQANLMEKNTVWPAMAQVYEENAHASFAERLVAALEAAQAQGGDIRGKQSAAILVVRGKSTGQPWADKIVDLRVDDSEEPIKELKRLLKYHRAYEYMEQGDACSTSRDWKCAVENYGEAEKLLPEQMEVVFWHAVTLVTSGEVEAALPLFRKVFAREPKWAELVGRLPKADLLPDDPKLLERIKAQLPR
ncbi:MAG: DUF1028 domain-containing protein [Candidatus Acidiferrum sp.]